MDKIILKQIFDKSKEEFDSIKECLDIVKLNNDIKILEEASLDASFWIDNNKAKATINKLNDLKNTRDLFNSIKNSFETIELIYESNDIDSFDEVNEIENIFNRDYEELSNKLLLNKEEDRLNAIVEIHSGAGGTESLDWCSMLFRMYQMYASKNKYKVQILDYQEGDEVGIKSVSFSVSGEYAYGMLKGESGVHRLVRLSPFDSDHARHTTFASVYVIPEVNDDIDIVIKDEDIRVDVFHSSGAGGQGVNTTDSAVRITHIPSKIVVTCQNERSQIQNKEACMKVLKSKLYQIELQKRKESIDSLNTKQDIAFGSQIRSYIFHPYSLIKDHRTDHERRDVDNVMNGDLSSFISSYLKYKGKENV